MQIRGSTQILTGTVPWAAMATGAIVPTTSLVDGAKFIKSDGTVTMTAALNLGGNTPINSAAPVNATDVANKAYVDAKTGGIGGFHAVRAVGATNVSTTAAPAAVDGVTLAAGDIVLLKGQTTGSQNGPWAFAASGAAMTRPSWWTGNVAEGQYFIVAEGTVFADTKFFLTTIGTITVDTTATSFVQDASGVTYSAGTGLTLTGNAFSVNYGTTAGTAAQGNDARILGALQTSALGTGVAAALGTAVGSVGAPVLNGGVLGTPSAGSLVNCSGLPTTGLTGALAAAQFPALSGDVSTAAGSLATTVNATPGSGFLKYGRTINNEVPTGAVNGSNAAFTLANVPQNGVVSLYLNGIKQQPGSGKDYTISAGVITFVTAPSTGDIPMADYQF